MAQEDRVKRLLALEQSYYARAAIEIAVETEAAVERTKAEMARRNFGDSGPAAKEITQVWFNGLEQSLRNLIEIRRRLLKQTSELASPKCFEHLQERIDAAITSRKGAISKKLENEIPQAASALDDDAERLSAKLRLEVDILRQETELGVHVTGLPGSTVINVHDSTVGTVSLGAIMGDVQSTVQALHVAGASSLETARAIDELVGAVTESTELTLQQQQEVVEVLAELSRQALKPEGERQIGPIKAAWNFIREAMGAAKDLGELVTKYGPIVERNFDL